MDDLERKYLERRDWFRSHIGKRIYRVKSICKCGTCTSVYEHGIVVFDEDHADYLRNVEAEMNLPYFAKIEERDEFVKSNPDYIERLT